MAESWDRTSISVVREYTASALNATSRGVARPFIRFQDRQWLRQKLNAGYWDHSSSPAWEEQPIHVDFGHAELVIILLAISKSARKSSHLLRAYPNYADLVTKISGQLRNSAPIGHQQLVCRARTLDIHHALRPCDRDVQAFLEDAASGCLSTHPSLERISRSPIGLDGHARPHLYRSSQLRLDPGPNQRRRWPNCSTLAGLLIETKLDL